MSTFTKKFAATIITATTVVSMSGFGAAILPVAHAQTTSDLQAQISALLAQIATLQAQLGGSTTGGVAVSCTFTRSLTVGSTGQDVLCLQQYLNASGHTVATAGAGSPGNETTFFGSRTQAAVAAWQAANGVAPAVGYFGPISMAKYNQLKVVVTPPPAGDDDDDDDMDNGGGLEGGAGSITDADWVTSLNNEEVGEGENDVKVAGMVIEAGEESDIEIIAVTFDFEHTGTVSGSDTDLDDYADEVSVWFNGKEVARVNASEFDDDNNYSRTLSIKSGAIIRADKTGELVLALSGVKNLDSGNAAEVWNVAFEGVRFRDGQSAVITESTQGDIAANNDDNTTDAGERAFSFETFATASDVEFKIMTGSDSINDSHVVDVDDVNDTDNVDVFSFVVRIDGNSDVQLKDLLFTATHTGTANSLDDIFKKLNLEMDGVVVGSESTLSGTTVTFDDIDTWLEAGEDYNFTLVGDINDTGSTFVDGDTVLFTLGETETDSASTDIEDENGDNLADADKTGSEASEAIAFFDNGIEITSFNDTGTQAVTVDSTNNDYVELVLNFTVHNFGDTTLYIPNVVTNTSVTTAVTPTAPAASEGVGYHIQSTTTTPGSNDISATLTHTAGDFTLKTNSFELAAGKSGTLRVKVTVANDGTPDLSGTSHRAFLAGVNWATSDTATGSSQYTFDLTDYFTDYSFIAD